MACGILFTMIYIIQIKFFGVKPWFLGISAEGIGTIGMLINFALTIIVSKFTPEPPQEVQDMVENIRYPRGAGEATGH